jgi:hypothetical protein
MKPEELDGAGAAGQPNSIDHVCDGADLGELALVTRHEEHLLGVAHVYCQSQIHVREDHKVFQRDHQQ